QRCGAVGSLAVYGEEEVTMALVNRLQGLLADEDPTEPYLCPGCGSRFELQYHVCPDCGGYSIQRRWTKND
ncbi:hypothetical protein, partial [Halolamina pelagica]